MIQRIIYSFFRALKYIGPSLIVAAVFIFVGYVRHKKRSLKKAVVIFMASLYLLSLFDITGVYEDLHELSYHKIYVAPNVVPFVRGDMRQMILNLLVFTPIGIFIQLIFPSHPWTELKILAIGLIFSFLIETIQLFGGRCWDIDDIIMNSLGVLVGWILIKLVRNRVTLKFAEISNEK
jgi:glycopeptide antibiotics resistance protein